MPASFTRAQNGSNIGSNGFGGPIAVVGAAVRITMRRAPWSSAHSSSSHGPVDVGQREVRRVDDPALVVEAPVLVRASG